MTECSVTPVVRVHDKRVGCTIEWDGEFRCLPNITQPEGCVVIDGAALGFSMLAACFLSGWTHATICVWSDGKEVAWAKWVNGSLIQDGCNCSEVPRWPRMILCGPACQDPGFVARFCHDNPSASVYVCQVVEELPAFGFAIHTSSWMEVVNEITPRNVTPRRLSLSDPRTDELDAPGQSFDPSLPGDGFGRMAHLVSMGIPVVNQMRTSVGITPFYGHVLQRELEPESVCIVRSQVAQDLFPSMCPSIYTGAATSVPVTVPTSPKFRRIARTERESVPVLVASDYVPDLPTFMRFYRLMSGLDFVASNTIKSVELPHTVVAHRYNKGYRATREQV